MDGSTSNFLFDLLPETAPRQTHGLGRMDGILYVEDFDTPPPPLRDAEPPAQPPSAPVFTAADMETMREAGRREGMDAALADTRLVQAQLQAAATQALADAISASRGTLERVVAHQSDEIARLLLGILQAAIPSVMASHARAEIGSVIAALLPGLRCEPELRVRTHPDLADFVRETLIGMLAEDGSVLSVAADPSLNPGDIMVFWEDGQARRSTASIYADIVKALAPLGLPALEEICGGRRS